MSSQSSSPIEEQKEIQEQHKLLITSNFVNKSKRFKNHAFIVQGEPFSWGITIKNIDTKPSPEAVVTLAGIKDLNEKYFQYMEEDEKYVRSLNPNEEIYIEIDRATIYLEGMQWCYVDIEPKNNNHLLLTSTMRIIKELSDILIMKMIIISGWIICTSKRKWNYFNREQINIYFC